MQFITYLLKSCLFDLLRCLLSPDSNYCNDEYDFSLDSDTEC